MARTDDTSSKEPLIPWFYCTRFLGATMVLFGLLADASAERGTIIITGVGLLLGDKVARNEKPPS